MSLRFTHRGRIAPRLRHRTLGDSTGRADLSNLHHERRAGRLQAGKGRERWFGVGFF
jgi:hypothetical protein